MSVKLPEPVRVWCACGPTYVFLGWPTRPCGKCGQRVTLREPEAERVS